jgi:hypothetical protein
MKTTVNPDLGALNEKIERESLLTAQLSKELSKVIVGQQYLIDRLIISLLANGHVLLEGVPGLAKTLAIKTLLRLWMQNSAASSSPLTCCRGPAGHHDLQPAEE